MKGRVAKGLGLEAAKRLLVALTRCYQTLLFGRLNAAVLAASTAPLPGDKILCHEISCDIHFAKSMKQFYKN
jgi:hypothetical protein